MVETKPPTLTIPEARPSRAGGTAARARSKATRDAGPPPPSTTTSPTSSGHRRRAGPGEDDEPRGRLREDGDDDQPDAALRPAPGQHPEQRADDDARADVEREQPAGGPARDALAAGEEREAPEQPEDVARERGGEVAPERQPHARARAAPPPARPRPPARDGRRPRRAVADHDQDEHGDEHRGPARGEVRRAPSPCRRRARRAGSPRSPARAGRGCPRAGCRPAPGGRGTRPG